MGEKYQLMLLSNIDNMSILTIVSDVLMKYGWHYNKYSLGRHSYWSEGPIWEFGNSKEITESETDRNVNVNRLINIIKDISPFYSQSIVFHKYINERTSQAISAIVESPNLLWKEVCISFELDDLLPNNNSTCISKEIKEMFIDLSTFLKPYYGKTGIEMKGLVDEPRQLRLDESNFGDFNYFSFECFDHNKFDTGMKKYKVLECDKIGKFIFTSEHISGCN